MSAPDDLTPLHATPLDALALDGLWDTDADIDADTGPDIDADIDIGTRPHIVAETFQAWRMPAGRTNFAPTSRPLDVSAATTLSEAVRLAAAGCAHKDHFTVLQTTPDGPMLEHVYYVKQRAPVWRADPDRFGAPRRHRDLAPERRFSREVTALAPVEPWRWEPGCDVVGRDAGPSDGISGEG